MRTRETAARRGAGDLDADGKARGELTKEAAEAVDRMQDHLATECKIKLEDWPLTVGRVLKVDAEKEVVIGDDAANKLLTREYRKGFAVPDVTT